MSKRKGRSVSLEYLGRGKLGVSVRGENGRREPVFRGPKAEALRVRSLYENLVASEVTR